MNSVKFLNMFIHEMYGSTMDVLTSEVLRCNPQLLNKSLIIREEKLKFLILFRGHFFCLWRGA
jgi:hypothetical protein